MDDATKGNTDQAQNQGSAAAATEAAKQAAVATAGKKEEPAAQAAATKKTADEQSLLGGDESAAAGTQKEEGKDQGKKDEGKKDVQDQIPEAYEFKAPEGMQLDPKAVELVTPVLKELGVTQGKVQKVVDMYAALKKEEILQSEMALLTQRKAWREDIKKNPQWQENLSLSKKGLSFGSQNFQNMIKNSWMGDHPDVIEYLANVGRMAGDAKFVEGRAAAGTAKKNPENIVYPNQK
jgi:hypothetical protein